MIAKQFLVGKFVIVPSKPEKNAPRGNSNRVDPAGILPVPVAQGKYIKVGMKR